MKVTNKALLLAAGERLSNNNWALVEKAKLPSACFLDSINRRYPVREADQSSGVGIDGRYRIPGSYNKTALLAAWAALENKSQLDIPAPSEDIRGLLTGLMEKYQLGPYAPASNRVFFEKAAIQLAQETLWLNAPGSFEETRDKINSQLRKMIMPAKPGEIAGMNFNIEATFPGYVIFQVDNYPGDPVYYKTDWKQDGDKVVIDPNFRQINFGVVVKEALSILKATEQGKRNSTVDETRIRRAVDLLLMVLGELRENSAA